MPQNTKNPENFYIVLVRERLSVLYAIGNI